MINVSDSCFMKGSFDFEECTSMDIDCWPSKSETIPSNTTPSAKQQDESIISIFAQSIEIFGSSMAPWPNSGKSIPEQVAGIFISSEIEIKDETVQSRLEATKPQIQSKLRRSSGSKRVSIARINEEDFFDSQKLYSELEPIPIVTVERKLSIMTVTREKEVEVELFEAQKERNSKSSRLQNWLSSLYARSNSKTPTKDEESGLVTASSFDQKPIKSILKKKSSVLEVQKSASIPETEAIKITSAVDKPKKSIKIRFDNEVSVCETFHKDDYCRQSLDYVARQLTPSLALAIKKELNTVKQEMEVHDDAKHLTQFYLIK